MAVVSSAGLRLGLILALTARLFTSVGEAGEKPNIVFLFADDLGYGDIACYGAPDARTPNLDRLARQGVRFTHHYSNGTECSPTRTALLSGRYQQRIGGLECAIGTGNVGRYDDAIRLAEQHDLGLPPGEAVLPRAIKQAGYATAAFGKWHLGYEAKFTPLAYGFDRFFGCLGGNVDYFTHKELSPLPVLYLDRKPVEREGYMTHLIAHDALAFIRENKDRPFFLYVPFTTPHFPFQGPNDAGIRFTKENWTQGTRAKYVELLEDLDTQIGRILGALDDTGLTGKTLVVFASDNGAMAPGRNLPFRNYKSTVFEGGIRVPLIVRYPGRIRPSLVSQQPCITMDLTRSFLRIAGAKPPADRPLDGIDIIAHVEGNRPDCRRTLFWRGRRGDRIERAVRDGNLKYVHRHLDDGSDHESLFDLARDPEEKNDLLGKRPADASRLKALLADWEREVRPAR